MTSIDAFLTSVKDAQKSIKEIKANLKKKAKENFNALAKEIFEEFPVVEQFSWTQYTPYWCDGDICEFEANVESLSINKDDDEDEDEDDGFMLSEAAKATASDIAKWRTEAANYEDDSYGNYLRKKIELAENKDKAKTLLKAQQGIATILKKLKNTSFEEFDIFEQLFGDHCRVTVNRKGVKISSYEHD